MEETFDANLDLLLDPFADEPGFDFRAFEIRCAKAAMDELIRRQASSPQEELAYFFRRSRSSIYMLLKKK